MPCELRAAIKQYLASDETELENDNSWGFVLNWLLCAAQAENRKSLIALLLELVVTAEEEEFHDWMTMRLNTTMGTLDSDMTAHPQGQTGLGGGQGHMSAVDMGAIIGCSIVAAVQTLTPSASRAGGGVIGNEMGTKDKYSTDKVAAPMGFAHINAAPKLPQFWKWVQASRKLRGDATDTFQQIITEDMATWAYDNRCNIDIGVFLEKKTIDSIISMRFNPGGCVAQYATAEQGISVQAFQARSTQETETLKAQELVEEKMVATWSHKESLKLAQTTVRVPALTYQDVKFNITMFCAFLWTLFGDKCDYYKEVLKVLQVLESADVYAMRELYSMEVCRHIIWTILHEGHRFFDKKLLSTAFTLGRMVEYPMCLLNILDEVHNAEMIQRSTYPQAWLTNREQL